MPKLLDLFCGAGGAGMGYHRAGFEVVGVDINPQPNYPFEFIQGDALEVGRAIGAQFNAIHASPPCQRYSEATPMKYRDSHPDMIAPTREMLQGLGLPYSIENVENARGELIAPVKLCGTMFGLPIWRHRYFEMWPSTLVLTPPCNHRHGKMWTVKGVRMMEPVLCTGGGDGRRAARQTHRPRGKVKHIRLAMELPWMLQRELTESIPPAYTEFIGKHLMAAVKEVAIEQP